MTAVGPGVESLGDWQLFCLHEQGPDEAQAMWAASQELRCARQAAGYSRAEMARRLGVAVDVVVAIENGYGCLSAARPVVDRAWRLAAQHK